MHGGISCHIEGILCVSAQIYERQLPLGVYRPDKRTRRMIDLDQNMLCHQYLLDCEIQELMIISIFSDNDGARENTLTG